MSNGNVLRATLTALVTAAVIAASARAQYHEDTRYGFKFKPPDEFIAVALNPNEFITVAKYQAEAIEYGGAQGNQGLLRMFRIQHWPIHAEAEEEPEDEPDGPGDEFDDFEKDLKKEPKEKVDPVESAWSWAGAQAGPHEVVKTKTLRSGGNTIEERYLRPEQSEYMFYAAVIEEDDGVFLFLGDAFEKRFDKIVRDYSKATKSFQRIEKDGSATGRLGLIQQSTDQEAWLEAQIAKLPPGWDHMRSERYLYLFSADKGFMKDVAKQMESIRSEYEKLFPPQVPIEDISIVRITNNAQEYAGYGGPPNSNGYWSSSAKELVLFDRRPREQMLETLNHEAFHQYVYYYAGQLSPHDWYNEGHGEYFGGARMTRTKRVTDFGPRVYTDRMPTLREALRLSKSGAGADKGGMIHVRDLIKWKRAEFYDRANIGRAYAQAWALVYMLRTEQRKLEDKWNRILPTYLENLKAARHEMAVEEMNTQLENARKRDDGGEDGLSLDPEDYYGRLNLYEIQDATWQRTFGDWTDEEWERFDEFYFEFCEDL